MADPQAAVRPFTDEENANIATWTHAARFYERVLAAFMGAGFSREEALQFTLRQFDAASAAEIMAREAAAKREQWGWVSAPSGTAVTQ